jgi:Fe2+ transport system protein B
LCNRAKLQFSFFVRNLEKQQQAEFVPSNTLLEPNNVIPSWECGGEEIKEVSVTMRKLRQQYDLVRRQVEAKEEELSRVKRKLEHQQNEEYFIEDDVYQKSNTIQESLTESQQIKEASEFELMKQR